MARYIHLLLYILFVLGCGTTSQKPSISFRFSLDESMINEAVNGRLLLMISNNDDAEPRFQINDGLETQMIFGVDVSNCSAGEEIEIAESVFGFPVTSLADVPEGKYYVQALLNRYEAFELATGHTV